MSHLEESKEQLSLQSDKPSTSNGSSSSSSVPSSAAAAFASSLPPSDVQLRPSYSAMFKPRQVESMMRSYVEEYLQSKQYDANESSNWAKDMAAHIKNKLKGHSSPAQQIHRRTTTQCSRPQASGRTLATIAEVHRHTITRTHLLY